MEIFTPYTNRNSDTTSDRRILKDISVTSRMVHHNLVANIFPRQDSVHSIFRNLMDEQIAAQDFGMGTVFKKSPLKGHKVVTSASLRTRKTC